MYNVLWFVLCLPLCSLASQCPPGNAAVWQDGAVDVVVVDREDGSLRSTGWYGQVGFSWFQSRRGQEVIIEVNNRTTEKRMTVCNHGKLVFSSGSPHHSTTEELSSLGLTHGHNQGRYIIPDIGRSIEFSIFLMRQDQKVIITDVDGTVTREDVMGFLLPTVGVSYHHQGVIALFSNLANRGYQVIYLSARSMALHDQSRDYLFRQLQDVAGHSMPLGALFHLPRSLLGSLYSPGGSRQKTSLMLSIWNCFESENRTDITDTLVAGYGNNRGDFEAYRNAGVERIYIVNTESVLVDVANSLLTSYPEQVQNIDQLYPPVA